MKTTEIFGRTVQMSKKGDVYEVAFGEDGVVYAEFGNMRDLIDEVIGGYTEGLKTLREDRDAYLHVVYKDGKHWDSRDDNKKFLRRSGIHSAVYMNGWFGFYFYNAIPTVENDEGLEIYDCEVKEVE